jgi:hypothetical protein
MELRLSMASGPTLALITIHQDRRPGGIARTQVARELIPQGSPAIQTMVSLKGYISTSEELLRERRATPNCQCVPPQFERHKY